METNILMQITSIWYLLDAHQVGRVQIFFEQNAEEGHHQAGEVKTHLHICAPKYAQAKHAEEFTLKFPSYVPCYQVNRQELKKL